MNYDTQNSYFSICIEIKHNIIGSVITNHWFIVCNKMTFAELKDLINEYLKIKSFSISFVTMYLDSEDITLNSKTLNFFLFKNGSKMTLVSEKDTLLDYDVDITTMYEPPYEPPKLKRSIGIGKYIIGHYISYMVNKPVILSIHYVSDYIHIIIPNGSTYEGNINKTYSELDKIGYKHESFATDDDITYQINSMNDSLLFYN